MNKDSKTHQRMITMHAPQSIVIKLNFSSDLKYLKLKLQIQGYNP